MTGARSSSDAGVRPFGISRDSPWTHVSWMQALDLTVPLLSDWNAEAVRGFGLARSVPRDGGRAGAVGLPRRPGRYGPARMALRRRRGAGPGRHRRGRAGVVALVLATYLAAGVVATWPALREANDSFLAQGLPARGETAPGDHLQTVWQLWLPGHQLERGEAPWLDPYSFQPEVDPRPNFAGWPFGWVFWPLHALLGTVVGWNAFVLLTFVGAGAFTFLWLRELGLDRGGALTGGLAFALAPYLVTQGAMGHLLAPVSMLLPLSLWALERSRRGTDGWIALAAAALASIPLSGQVHLALGAVPFFVFYALLRPPVRIAVARRRRAHGASSRPSPSTWPRSAARSARAGAPSSRSSATPRSCWTSSPATRGTASRPPSSSAGSCPLVAVVGLVALVLQGRYRPRRRAGRRRGPAVRAGSRRDPPGLPGGCGSSCRVSTRRACPRG